MSVRPTGQKVHTERGQNLTPFASTLETTEALADAIDRAFPTAKHAARAAGTNEPTARNWKRRRVTPSAKHVIQMMRESRQFAADMVALAGYDEQALAMKLDADLQQTKARIERLMRNWDEIKGRDT